MIGKDESTTADDDLTAVMEAARTAGAGAVVRATLG